MVDYKLKRRGESMVGNNVVRKSDIQKHEAGLVIRQTLAQQMKISERDMAIRKAMLGFTQEHEQILVVAKHEAAKHIDEIVEKFYENQLNHSEIALLIGDLHTLTKLKSSLRRYVLDLFDGSYDIDYVDKRLRIGKVHHRIGVAPKLYVSAVLQLQNVVEPVILPLIEKAEGPVVYEKFKEALKALFMFDMQLVFDTYIATLVTEVNMAKNEMEEYADSLEQVIAERTAQLEELSSRDALTGLYNQRVFYEQLRREIAVAERTLHPLALIYFDLNGFKAVNDSEGHKEGDRILKLVGECMRKNTRQIDIACRYGGDEFCLILPNTSQDAANEVVANRIIKAYNELAGDQVTFSMGITQTGPDHFCDINGLVKKADELMYIAKARSKENPGHHIEMEENHMGMGDPEAHKKRIHAKRQAS